MWICTTKTAGKGQDAVHALNLPFVKNDKEANLFLHAIGMELEKEIPESNDLRMTQEEGEIGYGSEPAYVDNSGIPNFYDYAGYIKAPVGAEFTYSVSITLKSIADNLKKQIKSLRTASTENIVRLLSSALSRNSPLLNDALSKHYVGVHVLKSQFPEDKVSPSEGTDLIQDYNTNTSNAKLESFEFTITEMVSKGADLHVKISGEIYFDPETIEASEDLDFGY